MKKSYLLQFALCLVSTCLWSQDLLFQETNLDKVYSEYMLDGSGVIVAIMDRGIDYTHPDFQNADGTTRILGIFDLSNDGGANDPNNPYGVGTILTEADINASLLDGSLLSRDAVGHGTITTGIAVGNGAASVGDIKGVAPGASIVVVKFTSEGAPAHDNQPAETAFYKPEHLEAALQFVENISEEYNMPFVLAANFGSAGDSMDGTSISCRSIDQHFGAGKKGKIFLTGSSDDGGIENHAAFTLTEGGFEEFIINKSNGNFLRFTAWYSDSDKVDIEIFLEDGSSKSYPPPSGETNRVQDFQPTYNFYHNGSAADFSQSDNDKREILLDLFGPAGEYRIKFTGEEVTNGSVDAWLNPSNIFSSPENRFLNHQVSGYTIWDWATANSNIAFNSYILSESYQDINGQTRTSIAGNDAGIGNIWPGSGVGPSLNPNGNIVVSVPGNINIGAYSQHSFWSTLDFLLIENGDRLYGTLAAVSGANPVITGVVALLLQADPELDTEEIRTILQETAREDSQTGPVPNPEWGYGKLDAYAAVRKALGISPTKELGIKTVNTWPNPTSKYLNVPDDLSVSNINYRIFNSIGNRVADGQLSENRIDVSAFSIGVYHVCFYSDNQLRTRSTFVKE